MPSNRIHDLNELVDKVETNLSQDIGKVVTHSHEDVASRVSGRYFLEALQVLIEVLLDCYSLLE